MTTAARQLVFAVMLASPLIGGCDFFKPKVSQEKLETALADWLKAHELEATDIHCPDNQLMENGNTFECTCKVHGAEIPVSVKVTNAADGEVEWKPKYLTTKREEFQAAILASPDFKGHDLELDCHDHVWVSIPDSEWTCDITDKGAGGKQFLARVKFLDGEGNYEMNVEPK